MPTTTLSPAAEGTSTAWTLGAGASKTSAVSPPDDDSTSYITITNNDAAQGFTLSDLPSYALSINSHTARIRERLSSAPDGAEAVAMQVRLAGNTQPGILRRNTAWTTSIDVDLARPGGGIWSVADVNATELEVRGNNLGTASATAECSTLSWDVTYEGAPGGFVFLVIAGLGPLVAVALHELPGLAAAVSRRTRTLILPGEYVAAWRELREWRHPRHFLMWAR